MQKSGRDGNSMSCTNSFLAPGVAATKSYRERKPAACIATKKGIWPATTAAKS